MLMEAIEIQCDSNLQAKFVEVGLHEFYKDLPLRFEDSTKIRM